MTGGDISQEKKEDGVGWCYKYSIHNMKLTVDLRNCFLQMRDVEWELKGTLSFVNFVVGQASNYILVAIEFEQN